MMPEISSPPPHPQWEGSPVEIPLWRFFPVEKTPDYSNPADNPPDNSPGASPHVRWICQKEIMTNKKKLFRNFDKFLPLKILPRRFISGNFLTYGKFSPWKPLPVKCVYFPITNTI